jgi:hypothetical protein
MRAFYRKPSPISCIAIAFVIFFYICSFSLTAEPSKQAHFSAEELFDLYENMYSKIHNIHVYYTDILEDIKKNESGQMPPYIRFNTTEAIEEGTCEKYYTRWTHDPSGFIDTAFISEEAFDGSITMQYGPETKSGRITPGRTGLPEEQMCLLWSYMLLHRPFPHKQPDKSLIRLLTPESTVRPQLEQVNGHWCHVIDAPYTVTPWATIWLAVGKGGLPIKYERYSGVKGYMTRINVIKVGSVKTETGAIWYPEEATKEIIDRDGYKLYRFNVKSIKVNIETNTETFKVFFPPGTEIADEVAGLFYTSGGTDDYQSIDGIIETNNNSGTHTSETPEDSISVSDPVINQNKPQKTLTIFLFIVFGILAVCTAASFIYRRLMSR